MVKRGLELFERFDGFGVYGLASVKVRWNLEQRGSDQGEEKPGDDKGGKGFNRQQPGAPGAGSGRGVGDMLLLQAGGADDPVIVWGNTFAAVKTAARGAFGDGFTFEVIEASLTDETLAAHRISGSEGSCGAS